jgi:hypothetical protein
MDKAAWTSNGADIIPQAVQLTLLGSHRLSYSHACVSADIE